MRPALDIRLDCPVTLIDHSGARAAHRHAAGRVAARAAIIAVPPGVMANETLRFSPALPAKLEAAARAAARRRRQGVPRARPRRRPADGHARVRLDHHDRDRQLHAAPVRPAGDRRLFRRRRSRARWSAKATARSRRSRSSRSAPRSATTCANASRRSPKSAWARDPWSLGAYSYGNPGAQAARAALAAPVNERLFFAGEHCSETDFSTAHGAYRTGVTAAEPRHQGAASSAGVSAARPIARPRHHAGISPGWHARHTSGRTA